MFRPLTPEERIARFWAKVRKGNECWEWTGTRNAYGYGVVSLTHTRRRMAHRVSWEMHHGTIPDGLLVCHRCDNRRCVRPDHLFLGTAADNNADCDAKGRKPHGSAHANAKLNEAQVLEIRLLARKGVSAYELARRVGVSRRAVQLILAGATWRRLDLAALAAACPEVLDVG